MCGNIKLKPSGILTMEVNAEVMRLSYTGSKYCVVLSLQVKSSSERSRSAFRFILPINISVSIPVGVPTFYAPVTNLMGIDAFLGFLRPHPTYMNYM